VKLSQVCIERPVFTTVLSLLIVLFGGLGLSRLTNRELPAIDPPVVTVTTVYPGAAAQVVETSLTQPIEEAVNGIEGVKHVTSTSREEVSEVRVEFTLARDIEAAANDVRDRVGRIRGTLPEDVDDPVIAKQDSDASPIMWMALLGGDRFDQVDLTRIAETRVVDRLAKLPGVASIINAGERRFSMRIWIDNRRLASRDLTISDVAEALSRENVDIPSGRLESEDSEITVRSLGELKRAPDYENLIVARRGGEEVVLADIADVETGPESERKLVRFNSVPAVGLGVIKQSQANTIDVADAVAAELEQLNEELPEGAKLEIAFDGSRYIRQSIQDVSRTIVEAALLVVLVIYVFLRSARATIIPALAIPVSVVGAFGFLYFLGFTINTLTLMGVTLAIGLVVDDAIVVLENITRWVENGTPPMEAARRGMEEISFAVVAATISAVAVFLPLVFLTDTTGRLFREFAVTVASAVAISGFVALTLSPMMAARVLGRSREEGAVKRALGRGVDALRDGYGLLLRPVIEKPWVTAIVMGLTAVWVAAGVWLYGEIDEELMPGSDRNVVFAFLWGPEGSTVEYMDRYQRQAEALIMEVPEVRRNFSIIALGIGTPGTVNRGLVIVQLVPREERMRSQEDLRKEIEDLLTGLAGVDSFVVEPSPIRGFNSDPIELVIQGPDLYELARVADEVARRAEDDGLVKKIRTDLELNKPELQVEIDRERASDVGLSVREIATTLQILLGGLDLSTFKLDGETYNVMAQLRRDERTNQRHLLELAVRGNDDELIPLSSVVELQETVAPRELPHFDRFRSVRLTGGLAEGRSQGEVLERIHQIALEELPESSEYRVAFAGESEKFFESGDAIVFAYALAILVVYLVLAAQFESFLDPLSILVAVLLSFTGALIALEQMDDTLNIYSKIGIVMLVGLVTKNSILIVEFANQLRGRNYSLVEATYESARTRFRPILMTSLATMVGIAPIAAGFGAGGESRAPLGVAVVGGMFFSTLFTIFVVPATYLVIEKMRSALRGERGRSAESGDTASASLAGGS